MPQRKGSSWPDLAQERNSSDTQVLQPKGNDPNGEELDSESEERSLQAALEKHSDLQVETRACHGTGHFTSHATGTGCEWHMALFLVRLPWQHTGLLAASALGGRRETCLWSITHTLNRMHNCRSNRLPTAGPEPQLPGQQCWSSCSNRAHRSTAPPPQAPDAGHAGRR